MNRALILLFVSTAMAQQPFYTDDAAVTAPGTWHFEFFNEFDLLQPELYPNLRQNTSNFKLNYGLPHGLEVDVDSPYIGIFRAPGSSQLRPFGIGDTNVGLKWNFKKEPSAGRAPAMSVTFYVELPSGDTSRELGSGLIDYWLNGIAQKHLTEKTVLTVNAGILFAGNTSTGLVGINTTRGGVITGGISLIRQVTRRLALGGEMYGGVTSNFDLGRSQMQFLGGGKYEIHKGFTFDFGVLGGKFEGSPRGGLQLGISLDIPSSSR